MARTKTVLLLAVVVLLAGCSGGTGGGGEEAATAGAPEVSGDQSAESGGGGDGDGKAAASFSGASTTADTSAIRVQRQLIFTGKVRLRVTDFDAAQRNVTRLTNAYGGFVSDSTRNVNEAGNETWTEGRLVLRVPRGNFSALYRDVQKVGEVQHTSKQSRDVTDKIVDLKARLKNLRAERARLRTLYEQANETEDVLRVQNRLSEVQGEIERIQAQLRSLKNRVAFSTITVTMQEDRPEPDPRPSWWQTPLVQAFLQSVDGVIITLRAISVGLAYVLPYAVVFGTPLAGATLLYRRRGAGVPSLPSRGDGGDGGGDSDGSE